MSAPMPAAFLGHGNPMNALEHNRYTEAWRRFGEACESPRAILCVSAHWYTNATAVTVMESPRTIHDFYGFPEELGAFQYPAPGSPGLAERVIELAAPDYVGRDANSWGIDHGAWSVLAHAFPEADVPVVQLSINALKPFHYHMDLGRRLAPLRDEGVVIVASGNLAHNLRRVEWRMPDGGFAWARRFDAMARDIMGERPGDAVLLPNDDDFPMAAPTPDHFIPLLYFAALADEANEGAAELVDGLAYGSISMTAFAIGIPGSEHVVRMNGHSAARPATITQLPDTSTVPAEQMNL